MGLVRGNRNLLEAARSKNNQYNPRILVQMSRLSKKTNMCPVPQYI